jgi:hypothetical protein
VVRVAVVCLIGAVAEPTAPTTAVPPTTTTSPPAGG